MKCHKSFLFICFIALISLGVTSCSKDATMNEKTATATVNVEVLPFAFVMDGLDRQRTIRLYLPPNYHQSQQAYPVLYMHDGQNLFDERTAYAGEWNVDESLNQLAQQQILELIVVAIDNGGDKRMNELSPWENKRFGPPEGKEYMDFIVNVVKPYIDSNFRTLSDVKHTGIMGSSMGGLISHYAIHAYPTVFGMAGIFSPSYWYSTEVFEFTKTHKADLDAKLYILFGDKEGDGMIVDSGRMMRQLKTQGHPRENTQFKRIAGGEHNELLWREAFPEAVTWLFSAKQ